MIRRILLLILAVSGLALPQDNRPDQVIGATLTVKVTDANGPVELANVRVKLWIYDNESGEYYYKHASGMTQSDDKVEKPGEQVFEFIDDIRFCPDMPSYITVDKAFSTIIEKKYKVRLSGHKEFIQIRVNRRP
jgi:hypothetical protein